MELNFWCFTYRSIQKYYLNHQLIIAKLNSYGVSWTDLKLIHVYLSNRKYRTRVNNSFSEWVAMFEVIHRSILRPLLFNNCLADFFLMHGDTDIANFADEKTPCTSAKNTDVIELLEQASVSLFKWFELNLLKSNVN